MGPICIDAMMTAAFPGLTANIVSADDLVPKEFRYLLTWVCRDILKPGLTHRHYTALIMGAMASQITSLAIGYSTVYSGADQRKHQSSASRWSVNSPHKWPVTRKMFPFDDVIMVVLWRSCFHGYQTKQFSVPVNNARKCIHQNNINHESSWCSRPHTPPP